MRNYAITLGLGFMGGMLAGQYLAGGIPDWRAMVELTGFAIASAGLFYHVNAKKT